jgi:hypothetical protein
MSLWRRQALAELPELRSVVEGASTIMTLWSELESRLSAAYDEQPPDEQTIRQIYRHAVTTFEESPSAEARTAVVVAFFEHVPTHARVRADVHRWLQPELFHQLETAFRYFLSQGEFEDFVREYRIRRAAWLR